MRSMYRVEDVWCENEGIVVLPKAVNPGYDILLLNVIGHCHFIRRDELSFSYLCSLSLSTE